jgi:hypothetical protein
MVLEVPAPAALTALKTMLYCTPLVSDELLPDSVVMV